MGVPLKRSITTELQPNQNPDLCILLFDYSKMILTRAAPAPSFMDWPFLGGARKKGEKEIWKDDYD